MGLFHDEKYFNEESVKQRARQYGFNSNLPVELFLWDCEIAAQIQNHSDHLILKGGAAVQLHLPVEMQRGSVDIDMIGPTTEQEIDNLLTKIQLTLPNITFEKHYPKAPIHNIPLITYFGTIPSLISERKQTNIRLKTEFLIEDLNLDYVTLPKAKTFALETKNIRCYSKPTLIGDKLLTLAKNTIGIINDEDVPKQIYDVATLSKIQSLTPKDFSIITDTINTLVPVESRYRKIHSEPQEVLKDVQNSLEQYCLLGTTKGNKQTWNNINKFQQFYVSTTQRKNRDGWSETTWRLKFITEIISSIFRGESTKEASAKYLKAVKTSTRLTEIKSEEIREIRIKLLENAKPYTTGFKELKQKSLNRIFWQIINNENVEIIESLL